MPYVQRDGSGKVKGLHNRLQPNYAEEFLLDDDPEVIAYRNPPAPAPEDTRTTAADIERLLETEIPGYAGKIVAIKRSRP